MLFLIAPFPLTSQEYRATLLGAITDSTGAVIQNARATVINRDTGVATTSESNHEGNWVIPYLLPGVYELRVEQAGFKTFQRSPLELRVNDRLRIDVVLEVGQVTDRVTVSDQTPLLETASSARGQVIENRKITDLPLNAHNPFTLMGLAAGVQYTGSMQFFRPYDNGAIGSFSLNGGRVGANEFQIDGAPNNLVGQNNLAYVPPVEATQEFKIQTNTYDAQYGRTGGGVVSLSIKSGTNQYHGAAYEYLRRTALDANSFVNNANRSPRTLDLIDQWGFAVDGPVLIPRMYRGKDRTFFMFAFEKYRQKQPRPALGSVPTAEQRDGDFSRTFTSSGQLYRIYDPLTVAPNPAFTPSRPVSVTNPQFIRTPFANNRIPSPRMEPIALNVLKDIPLPNQEGDPVTHVNNWFAPWVTSDDLFRNIVGRVDHTFSSSIRVYGRWNDSYRDGSRRNNNGWDTNAGLSKYAAQRRNRGGVFDIVDTLNASTILTARAAFNRWRYWKEGPPLDISYLGFPRALLQQLQDGQRYPQFRFDGYLQTSEQDFDDTTNESYSAQGNILKILGTHTLKFGAEFRLLHYSNREKANTAGNYFFDRGWTSSNPQVIDSSSGNAMASFLMGYMSSGVATLNAAPYISWRYPVAFFQDDWQVSRKLTLNYGVRWDYESPPVERFDRQNRGFDYTAKIPYQVPGYDLRGGLLFAGQGAQPRAAFKRDANNLQPRFGLAYKPLASKPVVVRGGFGRYFLPTTEFGGQIGFSQTTAAEVSTADYLPLHVLSNPFPNGLTPPPGARFGSATLVGDAIRFSDPSRVIPNVWQYSAGVQWEVITGFLVEASYVGSQTRQIQVSKGLNFLTTDQLALGTPYLSTVVSNPFYGVLPINTPLGVQPTIQRRSLLTQYPQYTSLIMDNRSLGKSWYNALQLKVEQRLKHGFSYLVSYTISKTMETAAYLNASDTALSRELTAFDVPQRLALSGLYEFPVGPGHRWLNNGVASHIIGGWEFSWTGVIQSGIPMPYPNYYIQGDPALESGQNLDRWFNTSRTIWVQPPTDTLRVTKLRSSSIRRHTAPQIDLTLIRSFRISEGHRLQFKVSAFNATNSPIFDFPNTNPNSQLFGVVPITQLNMPRSVELGFRYAF
jgi:hypothetical protein